MNVLSSSRALFLSGSFFLFFVIASCSRHSSSESKPELIPPTPPRPKMEQRKRVKVRLPVAPSLEKGDGSNFWPYALRPDNKGVREIRQEHKKRRVQSGLPKKIQIKTTSLVSSGKRETVKIGGKTYLIPATWQGRRFTSSPITRYSLQKLPARYVHSKESVYVKKEVVKPLLAMMNAAASVGISLQVETAYRDAETQKNIFLRKFRQGRTWEDVVRYVAPPGYSEHMLGLAIDFYPSGWKFASTAAYRWLCRYGREYGFVESYPQNPLPGQTKIAWEAWHWFYRGGGKKIVEPEHLPELHHFKAGSQGNSLSVKGGVVIEEHSGRNVGLKQKITAENTGSGKPVAMKKEHEHSK